jgi:hypothetical protein
MQHLIEGGMSVMLENGNYIVDRKPNNETIEYPVESSNLFGSPAYDSQRVSTPIQTV